MIKKKKKKANLYFYDLRWNTQFWKPALCDTKQMQQQSIGFSKKLTLEVFMCKCRKTKG